MMKEDHLITPEDFISFYPQFGAAFPLVVIEAAVDSANSRFADFDEDTEEARRLFIAHRLTLYAKTALPESASGIPASASFAALAGAGDGSRVVSRKVDDVAVTYAVPSAAGSVSTGLTDLQETVFGRQLLLLLRLHAMPRYVP